MSTTALLLQQTFKRVFEASISDAAIRLQNEEIDDALKLPAVILTAQKTGEDSFEDDDGRHPEVIEFSAEARVAGNTAGSAEEVERLARLVRAALESADSADPLEEWRFLEITAAGDGRGFEDGNRSITQTWSVIALPVV